MLLQVCRCVTACRVHVCTYVSLCLLERLRPGACAHLPPLLDDLLAWSKLFRSHRTYGNYVNYVRTGCLLCKTSVEVDRVSRSAESVGRVPPC